MALSVRYPADPAQERLLPHSPEAEEAVVASILVDDEAIFHVADILSPNDFHRAKTRIVYEACLNLLESREPIDQISVARELARVNRLEEAGGLTYLSQLVTELPTSIGVEHFARIVARDAIYRHLITAAGKIAEKAYQGGPDVDEVLGEAEGLLLSVRGADSVKDFIHIKKLLASYLEEVGEEHEARRTVKTGFADLDQLLGGLKRSDLVILAARPSLGKSSLALNIARNAAVNQHARVAVFSLEMAAEHLAQRLLSAESGVDSATLRLGLVNEAQERRISNAMGVLSEADIYFDDTSVMFVSAMQAKANRLMLQTGLDLIVVDYLQLMHGGGVSSDRQQDNRVQEISFISRSLKQMARDLDVPVLACAQLSRAVEMRPSHIPMLSDLRESGSIEQDADVVMFIYREDRYVTKDEWEKEHPETATEYPAGVAQIIVAKHRNGPVGKVNLRFREKLSRFEDFLVRDADW
ncbi:MAG TPA: replicative DNA helicase [Dehalococcoidia bacterium]|nr:replicative DNA helicase [Dehalococcoidia bacterium]